MKNSIGFGLMILFCAFRIGCINKSEESSKSVSEKESLSEKDSERLIEINNKISELIMGQDDLISVKNELDSLFDSAFKIDSMDYLTNYNFYLVTGILGNYESRVLTARKLYHITDDPAFLVGELHADSMLKEEFRNEMLRVKIDSVLKEKIDNDPTNVELYILRLTYLCLLNSSDEVEILFKELRKKFPEDQLVRGIHDHYESKGCSAFFPQSP